MYPRWISKWPFSSGFITESRHCIVTNVSKAKVKTWERIFWEGQLLDDLPQPGVAHFSATEANLAKTDSAIQMECRWSLSSVVE